MSTHIVFLLGLFWLLYQPFSFALPPPASLPAQDSEHGASTFSLYAWRRGRGKTTLICGRTLPPARQPEQGLATAARRRSTRRPFPPQRRPRPHAMPTQRLRQGPSPEKAESARASSTSGSKVSSVLATSSLVPWERNPGTKQTGTRGSGLG